jgi:GT2 family glycosyltransferase
LLFVNYNSESLLKKAIESLRKSIPHHLKTEIIVVDNNSTNRENLKSLLNSVDRLILLPFNRGYSYALNRGIRLAKGKYIAIANADIEFIDNSLEKLVNFLEERSEAGAVIPQYLNPDGSLQTSTRKFHRPRYLFFSRDSIFTKLFPQNPLSREFLGKDILKKSETAVEVEVAIAAFMLVKKEVFEKVGYFDERFFMFSEDSDFCYRMRKAGWKVYLLKDAKLLHIKGASRRKLPFKSIIPIPE